MTGQHRIVALFFCLLSVSLTACSMKQPLIGNPQAPYAFKQPAVGDIVHLPTGVAVSLEQMTAAVSDTRIVYVGETHDNPAAHRLELQVLKALRERYPEQVSLGMEMFNTEQQPVLDQWVAGSLSEKDFLKESNWYGVWGQDFAYYRELVTYARDQQIPIIGLNVPAELRRKVGMTPLEELDEETRAVLPEMDMNDPYQTAMTEAIFAEHTQGRAMLEGFQRVQTLWDEAMAENIVKHLESIGPQQRMVVVAGGNHVRYGFGIPRRAYRRLPVSYALVGISEVSVPSDKQSKIMNVDLPMYPMVPYDYMVFTEYETLPGERVKLGVRMREEEDQVVIEAVVPDSAADQAGIEEGDIILAIDDVAIKENFDLVYEIKQRVIGEDAVITVERAGETLTLNVTFIPFSTSDPHKP